MSNSIITEAGLIAVNKAGQGYGPKISITSFRIGSSYGFQTSALDTDVHIDVNTGAYHGQSSQLSTQRLDNNTILYKINLDQTVGNFNIGNIGLYLADGTLFSLTSLDNQFPKLAILGNTYSISIILNETSLGTVSSITFDIPDLGLLPEVDILSDLPAPGTALASTYLVRNYPNYGHPVLASVVNNSWVYISETADADNNYLNYPSNMFSQNTGPGTVVYMDRVTGLFSPCDGQNTSNGIVGIVGPYNNIISNGLYDFTGSSISLTPGSYYFANGGILANFGKITKAVTDYQIGIALTTTLLYINIQKTSLSIGFSNTVSIDPVHFSTNLVPGMVVSYDYSGQVFVPGSANVLGILGYNNDIVFGGTFVHENEGVYIKGAAYYADPIKIGNLTTVQNNWYVGTAINTHQLMVQPTFVNLPDSSISSINTGQGIIGGPIGPGTSGFIDIDLSTLQQSYTVPYNVNTFPLYNNDSNRVECIPFYNLLPTLNVPLPGTPVWNINNINLGTYTATTVIQIQLQAINPNTNDPLENIISYTLIGGSIPIGTSISSTGLFSGMLPNTVSAIDTYKFTVRATDNIGLTADATFYIYVSTSSPIWSSPSDLGIIDSLSILNIQLQATSPQNKVLTYSLTAGSLPSGIILDSNTGILSGNVPISITSQDVYIFTITCTSSGQSTDRVFTLSVINQGPTWQTSTDLGIVNCYRSQNIQLTAIDNQPGITVDSYALTGGSLPSGMGLSANGLITGVPALVSVPTTYSFTVRATNSLSFFTDQQFTITLELLTINTEINIDIYNPNVITLFEAAGWDGIIPLNGSITIDQNVTIGSTGIGLPALVIPNLFPSGSQINIINNGSIQGLDNNGIGDGGTALYLQYTTNITNNGSIIGGGAGTGGGQGYSIENFTNGIFVITGIINGPTIN